MVNIFVCRCALVLPALAAVCSAFTPGGAGEPPPAECRRRDVVLGSLLAASSSLLSPRPALAMTPQEKKDRENIVAGHRRLQYLLDHWEEETTICKIGQETTFGDKCERNPVKVMEYLGFKSMDDPLFKADATMMRLKGSVPSDREAEFYDAVDAFAQNAEEANSMAFVSSWGEANPGGGKDRVRLFIERSKKNVVASRDSLGTVMDILGLSS